MGCCPWGCYESDTTERLPFHVSLSCIGEGNGNPLQCSCLENPRDGGAWWAAVYGVALSRTRLKQLSSSSISWLNLKFLADIWDKMLNRQLDVGVWEIIQLKPHIWELPVYRWPSRPRGWVRSFSYFRWAIVHTGEKSDNSSWVPLVLLLVTFIALNIIFKSLILLLSSSDCVFSLPSWGH